MRQYIDFKVELTALGSSGLSACAECALVGESDRAVQVSYDPGVLADRLLALADKKLYPDELLELGNSLGSMLLPESIGDLFRAALARLRDNQGLRVRLICRDEQLAALPWEYVHVRLSENSSRLSPYMVLDERVSFVRHEPQALPYPELSHQDTVRMLAATATRLRGYDTLVPAEPPAYDGVLADQGPFHLKLDVTEDPATLEEIARLAHSGTDIFHFTGHGLNPVLGRSAGGLLLASDPYNRSPVVVTGEQLAPLLVSAGVRLAVLNACYSGSRTNEAAFGGVATALIRAGVPAVVAMQYPIENSHAEAFDDGFYQALLVGLTIDEAIAEGRRKMHELGLLSDWGVPVLYSRLAEGNLFGIAHSPQGPGRASQDRRTTQASPVLPALAGRRSEQKTITAAIDALTSDDEATCQASSMLFLNGVSGVGKTALANFARHYAIQTGFETASVVCEPFHEGMSFFPVREIMRQLSPDGNIEQAISETFGRQSAEAHAAQAIAAENVSAAERRDAMVATFANLIIGQTANRANPPLFLFIDDLERLDAGSADALLCLMGRLREGRILVLTSCREDSLQANPVRAQMVRSLEREGARDSVARILRLEALSAETIGAAAEAILGAEARFDPHFLAELYRRTDGNPLFLREILLSLSRMDEQSPGSVSIVREKGVWYHTGDLTDLAVPDTVEETIAARLDGLEPAMRAELELAAVIGRRFAYEVMVNLSASGEDDLLRYLEAFIGAHLIREIDDAELNFEFSHGLMRDVLYQSMSKIRRRRVHGQVADVLLQLYGSVSEDWDALVGEHLFQAGRYQEAVPHLLRAARASMRILATAEAVNLYDRLLSAKTAFPSDEHLKIRIERAEALKLACRYPEAIASCKEIMQSATGIEFGFVANCLGDVLWSTGDTRGALDAYRMSEESAMETGDSGLQLETAADLCEMHDREAERLAGIDPELVTEHVAKARHYLKVELELAEKSSDNAARARAWRNEGKRLRKDGDLAAAIKAFERAIDESDSRVPSHQVLISYAKTLRFNDMRQQAKDAVDRVVEWSRQSGARRSLGAGLHYRAILIMEAATSEDGLAEARKVAETALLIMTDIGYARGRREIEMLLAEINARLGDLGGAETYLRRSIPGGETMAGQELATVAVEQLRAIDEGDRGNTLQELLSNQQMASQ